MATSSSQIPTTAIALQARISHLSLQLLRRYTDLLAATRSSQSAQPGSADNDGGDVDATTAESKAPPPAISTVSAQVAIEVESARIVKAAEEIMELTRGMKELWVFGEEGVRMEGQREGGDGEKEEGARVEEYMETREGMRKWVDGWVRRQDAGGVGGEGVVQT